MKKLNIALLSGGISSEREVSLAGGDQVFDALDKSKYDVVRYDPKTDLPKLTADAGTIDVALIILHGPYGEDGTIQGMLDLLGIPYQGSGVLGSAIAMHKLASKLLFEKNGLPVPKDIILKKGDVIDPVFYLKALGLPLVVKPVQGGSSIGMSLVKSEKDLAGAIEDAFLYDDTVMIEAYIEGIEITVSIIGNDDLEALPIVEIIPNKTHDFFNYKAKYTAGETQEICPAGISDTLAQKSVMLAKRAHQALFCKGCSRTDMIIRDEEIFILETNTIPGMTQTSLLPLAAETAGISFSKLMDRMIELALENKSRKHLEKPQNTETIVN
ncbi:MAG: D-alanine--D-alanine ligase [Desulfobacterales bacterium]|nr:D-alanine--D-alanine ligase [Desulfobacterales bacterium]